MAERKTTKEVQRTGTTQSIRGAKKGSKTLSAKDPKRSGSLQSIRSASTKKKTGKPKEVVRGSK